jgi:hypothetical protein
MSVQLQIEEMRGYLKARFIGAGAVDEIERQYWRGDRRVTRLGAAVSRGDGVENQTARARGGHVGDAPAFVAQNRPAATGAEPESSQVMATATRRTSRSRFARGGNQLRARR